MSVALKSWRANEGPKHLITMVWIAANVFLFWKTFMVYFSEAQYYYLHKMLGLGLCISRASASVLNFNCSLVLLPMCRSLLTFLRGSQRVTGRRVRRLLDKSKTFHVACGVTICIFSVVHVSAHLVNMVSFSVRYSEDFPGLNVAQYRGQVTHTDTHMDIFFPGVTGVLLVLVLFLMFTASSYCIRVSSYEIFWYTHNLFIVFYVILMVHVAGGALKYQSNVETHPPGCVHNNLSSWTNHRAAGEKGAESSGAPQTVCQEEARFQPHFPQTWLWVSAPLCLYCAERFYRFIRSSAAPVTIVSVISHPCSVVELRMLKSGFKPRPGQYILLNCPSVSSFENHPFTLTTVSPFVDDWRQYKLKRLYFVWVCRDLQSFYWFADLLCGLHERLWRDNRPDYLNVQLYLSNTQGLQSISEERYRFLSSRLRIGRPKWKLIFQEIGRANQLKRVGVFCCGPKGISKALHTLCNSNPHTETAFEYNKESFS
uniref:NADPH oxidase 4 n=1 Tax=Cyprinus carpio TaxID=7962 RepID=A0A8C2DZ69_CYPCA